MPSGRRGSIIGLTVGWLAAVALAVLPASCGGSDSQSGGSSGTGGTSSDSGGTGGTSTGTGGTGIELPPTPGPLPLDELGDAYETILCEVLVNCEGAAYRDVEHCKADREASGLEDLLTAIQEGRVVYDAEQMGECRRTFERNLCDMFFFLAPSVPDVVDACLADQGRQVDGQPCRDEVECASGHYCRMVDYACPGVCTPFQGEGDYCDIGSEYECDPGTDMTLVEVYADLDRIPALVAEAAARNLDCEENMCLPPAALGEPCVLDQTCLDGYCDDVTGMCQPFVGDGGACTGLGQACDDDLWCDQPLGQDDGVCRPLGAVGDACNYAAACQEDLVCIRPTVEYGQCAERAAEGAACTSTSRCQDGLGCDDTGTCVRLPGVGQPCFDGADCAENLVCQNEVCAELRFPGEACNDTDAACVGGVCRDGTCGLRAGLGEPCTEDNECASRDCIDGVCADDDLCVYRTGI